MKLDIDDDQMKSLLSEAIYASLDEKKRGALIKGALEHLLTPDRNSGYGVTGQTPIQRAFNNAIETVANTVVREELTKNEAVRAKIEEMMASAVAAFIGAERETMIKRMSDAIASSLTRRDDR